MNEAKSVLEQARIKGTNGDAFEQIEKRLASLEMGKDVNAARKSLKEPPIDQFQP